MIRVLGFLSPWMLVALAALPLVWLILRLTPPRPRRVDFPPLRLLFGMDEREKTPARTPWWLTTLRLLLLAVLITAIAEPVLRPQAPAAAGSEPLLVVLDNGWDTAPDFAARSAAAANAIAEAGRASRPVAFVATAEARAEALAPGSAADAARRLGAVVPQPYLANRGQLADRIAATFGAKSMDVLWLASALDGGDAAVLATALNQVAAHGTLVQSTRPLSVLLPPENGADKVTVSVARIGGGGDVAIAGFDAEGRRIIEGAGTAGSDGRAAIEIALPTEIRNAMTRIAVIGEDSAGAVQLLDGRWRRKAVGLLAGESAGGSQPLLEPLTYVQRALAPTADLMTSTVAANTSEAVTSLIRRGASMIVLTETGRLQPDVAAAVGQWIERGGTLVRFASANLAGETADPLLPVRLRQGERELGGSLSWEQPQPIGSFPAAGPFARIAVPGEVRINRQVLADPDALRDAQVWAELGDGTPLVTAQARGAGRIVLFHVTADPRWSNLPLSGAFVEMLNAIVAMAGTVRAPAAEAAAAQEGGAAALQTVPAQPGSERTATTPWKPVELLDGTGHLGRPDAQATLVADIESAAPGAETPPGLYSRADTVRALNAVSAGTNLAPLRPSAVGWTGTVTSLQPRESTPIWPWLLALAAILAVLDGLAVLALSGRLQRGHARAVAAALLLALLLPLLPTGARAQDADAQKNLDATLTTRLAYVLTGNAEIDETSQAGLKGLSTYLADRTALEPGEPAPIDLKTDELAFYALIYWPIDPAAATPPADVMARVDAFLKNGGTILFDTRDAGAPMLPGAAVTPETQKLRDILSFVDVPALEPVPPDHVLTKAFYLLTEFPGRWSSSDLWVENIDDVPQDPSRPARGGDGVSSVLITGNDFAAAWAVDESGQYLYPTDSNDGRQRELAFRAGVNIVMYTLTGNYKADQVHVPALLERLGQ